MIGDSTVDIQTGVNAGVSTVLVLTGVASKDGKYPVQPDYVVENLKQAVDLIILDLTGPMDSIATCRCLREEGIWISILVLAEEKQCIDLRAFDNTDYILTRQEDYENALSTLEQAGYQIVR